MAHEHDHEHDHDEHDHDEHEHELTDAEARAEAERLIRRDVALAQIRQYGDPVLRMRAAEVEEADDELRRICANATSRRMSRSASARASASVSSGSCSSWTCS